MQLLREKPMYLKGHNEAYVNRINNPKHILAAYLGLLELVPFVLGVLLLQRLHS